MDFGVDKCRRKPATTRALVYLDTSTYDAIAKDDPAARAITKALDIVMDKDAAICVGSPLA